jgi:Ca-activated chloride channel family protein
MAAAPMAMPPMAAPGFAPPPDPAELCEPPPLFSRALRLRDRVLGRRADADLPHIPPPPRRNRPSEADPQPIFSGVPPLIDGAAILFDSLRDSEALPAGGRLRRLSLRFRDGPPLPPQFDPDLTLHICVDDLAAPRARIRLADLVRHGGERPLNIAYRPGQRVQILLLDPNGAWAGGAREITVALG